MEDNVQLKTFKWVLGMFETSFLIIKNYKLNRTLEKVIKLGLPLKIILEWNISAKVLRNRAFKLQAKFLYELSRPQERKEMLLHFQVRRGKVNKKLITN